MGKHNIFADILGGFGIGDAANHPQDALVGRAGSTSDKRLINGAVQLPPEVYKYGSDALALLTGNPLIAGAGQYMASAAEGGAKGLAANLFPLDAKGIIGTPKVQATPAHAGGTPGAGVGGATASSPGGLPISGSTAPKIYPWSGGGQGAGQAPKAAYGGASAPGPGVKVTENTGQQNYG